VTEYRIQWTDPHTVQIIWKTVQKCQVLYQQSARDIYIQNKNTKGIQRLGHTVAILNSQQRKPFIMASAASLSVIWKSAAHAASLYYNAGCMTLCRVPSRAPTIRSLRSGRAVVAEKSSATVRIGRMTSLVDLVLFLKLRPL